MKKLNELNIHKQYLTRFFFYFRLSIGGNLIFNLMTSMKTLTNCTHYLRFNKIENI